MIKKSNGFTLIELLVVVAIIGILASIVSAALIGSRAKGRDAKRISDVKAIQLALETYFNDNGYYPNLLVTIVPNYLPSQLTDPSTGNAYFYTSYNLTSQSNSTCVAAPPLKYHLAAALESNDNQGASIYNSALRQDTDWTTSGTYTRCTTSGNGADFSGKANNAGYTAGCVGSTDQTYDTCYDLTN